MNHHFIVLASSAFILGFSCLSHGNTTTAISPEEAYYNLPAEPPLLSSENLTTPEKTTFSLYESVMNIMSAKVQSTSCSIQKGKYPINLYATGRPGGRRQSNMVTVDLPSTKFNLYAFANSADFGSTILVRYLVGINPIESIDEYAATFFFDSTNAMMSMEGHFELPKTTPSDSPYKSIAITSFNRTSKNETDTGYFTYYNWGLSSLSKLGYPTTKFWNRIKYRRDNGDVARTVFVKDFLAHPSPCRITIDTSGYNNLDYFWQEGYVTIEPTKPGDPVVAFDEHPFNELNTIYEPDNEMNEPISDEVQAVEHDEIK